MKKRRFSTVILLIIAGRPGFEDLDQDNYHLNEHPQCVIGSGFQLYFAWRTRNGLWLEIQGNWGKMALTVFRLAP